MRTGTKSIGLTSASLLGLCVMATGAAAQTAASPDTDSVEASTGEIVVTASKREQKLRDVPSAITVLGGDTLANLGVQSVRDYATLTPGLAIQDSGSPGYGKIFIRGLTTGSLQQSATTVYYIDDVPFTASSANGGGAFIAPDPELTDIERIEVLKGPQGTLYGASSLGGVIRLVSKSPDASGFSGSARAEMTAIDGGGAGFSASATLNLPLVTDRLALRATGFYREAPGFADNIGTGTDNVNRSRFKGGRLALRWTPTDRLTFDLVGQLQDIDTRGPALETSVAGTLTPLYGERKHSNFFDAPTQVRYRLASVTGRYDTDLGQIIATGAYLESKLQTEVDLTSTYAPFFPVFASVGYVYPANTGVAVVSTIPAVKKTAELRFVSRRLGGIEFVAGGFYTHERVASPTDVIARDMATNARLPGPLGTIITTPINDTYEELSAFGNLTVYLTDNLDVTGGLRFAHSTEDFNASYGGVYYTAFLGGPVALPPVHSSHDQLTYLATLRWRATPTLSFFARAASGYRPGGPQVAAIVPPGAQTRINPDTVWNYEVGLKGDFLDRKLSLEASVYRIDWNDIQLYTIFNSSQLLANAGKAKVDGFEIQLAARPTELLTATANLGYTNSRLAEVDPGVTAYIGAVAGDPIPQTSPWTASATLDQLIPLGGDLQGQLGATFRYQSRRFTSFPGSISDPNMRLPGRTTFDLRAGLSYRNYQLQLRAENITDRKGIANYLPGAPASSYLMRPRSFTVSVSSKF
ncbi:outer membrane receptor protein involved in Fe transport [Sphingopyxis panaciterrae]|uniref:TonB-dependent receptor n=1 Tax=Sphingopyxis panaciterrae TaxID=363841 RepID=UPI001421A2D1|nr:TonB-dependent receptor [Sphingopyxis panaciterrae]NIJ35840.1 outer membrane receptor protein involved in Fe transport [Sphingopyxis panaciterrae]